MNIVLGKRKLITLIKSMVFNATFNNIMIFQSQWYPGKQFYCWMIPKYPKKIIDILQMSESLYRIRTAGNRHKQNSWFCKEIREDNFRVWWRRVHEDASQGMYMSKIEILFFTARILQNQRMLCCGECFHDQKHVQFILVYEV